MSSPPTLSVIIPTRNRAALLADALRSLGSQTLARDAFEVVVVDDGSTDDTPAVCVDAAARLPLNYVRQAASGISAAKNLGIFVATGRLLFFFDDDDIASVELLRAHVASHEAHPEDHVAILGYTGWAPGLTVTPAMRYGTEIGQNVFSYPCIRHGQVLTYTNFWGGRTSCKRALLVRHGIFNQDFTFGSEDIELGFRLQRVGLQVIYDRDAVSYMNRGLTHADICRRSERQGRSLWRFSRLHADAPEIQDYCQVAGAVGKWREAAATLAGEMARVAAIEAALAAGPDAGERAALEDELWPLYRRTFEAHRLKGIVEAAAADAPADAAAHTTRARLIAFYLPQFHPIPENDAWWGTGFTEWTNVTAAVPHYDGHYQPHLPADLGFYDLRLAEARAAQATLAARHGIEAFCYWHYWFHGERLLERPFAEVLHSGEPDFPFCLAWANESWSRRWLGDDQEILKRQTYSPEDDAHHARWLADAFADRRYLRVDGRPVFLIYRPNDLPDPHRTLDILRAECERRGQARPYLIGIDAHCTHLDCRTLGFDATLDFEPQLGVVPGIGADGLKVHDYAETRAKMKAMPKPWPLVPCVFVNWDNTPRRKGHAIVLERRSVEPFEAGLRDAVERVALQPYEERLVFVNAWNEWAEGNHLEPDQRHGLADLEAVARVNLTP